MNQSIQPLLDDQFVLRLVLNGVGVFALVRGIYYRRYQRSELFFTFFAFNLAIFLIAFLLNRVEMTLGAAFGLFAVFSMLRYRTENITPNDMTYLFLVIALGLLMGVSGGGPATLVTAAAVLVAGVAIFESSWLSGNERVQDVWYDRVDLVRPERRMELLEDLRARTGLPVHRVRLREIDLTRPAARLGVYYRAD